MGLIHKIIGIYSPDLLRVERGRGGEVAAVDKKAPSEPCPSLVSKTTYGLYPELTENVKLFRLEHAAGNKKPFTLP